MENNDWVESALACSAATVGEWLETDEFSDVLSSLLIVRDTVASAKCDPAYWKWVVLGTHSALQGACVCLLTGTDGLGALTKQCSKAMADKLYGFDEGVRKIDDDSSYPWPDERVAELPVLLKRLPGNLRVVLPGPLKTKGKFDLAADLRRLHDYRNEFTHFSAKGWSLETAGLPRVVGRAIGLTRNITVSTSYKRHNKFPDLNMESVFSAIAKAVPIE